MQLGSKGTTYVAVGLMAVGFLFIFLGWNGAAGFDTPQQQIPYVISGGVAGIGLVLSGLTLAHVEARRRDTARLTEKIDQLIETMGGVTSRELEAIVTDEPATVAGRPLRRPVRRRSA